jgi:hypothetical protein
LDKPCLSADLQLSLVPLFPAYLEQFGVSTVRQKKMVRLVNGLPPAYVEVIPYDKLLLDAQARNAIFFDKLGLAG